MVSPQLTLVLNWQPRHDTLFSDHFPIHITTNIATELQIAQIRYSSRLRL